MSNASDLGQQAKEHAADLGDHAKAAAKQEAVARTDELKETAAGKVQAAADAADAASNELDPTSPQAQAVHQVADHIEDVAERLRTADVGQLTDQITQMARRNPLLFMGGSAIAGFAVARFLKARDTRPRHDPYGADPWSQPYTGSVGQQSPHQAEVAAPGVMSGDRNGY